MKFSIITATYNSARTLPDTLESVLAQTYRDVEYIIVDGLSTDGTMDIVRAYEPRFEGRLVYISERDKGLYDAMNKGLRMATGDVVGILNSDDFYSTPTAIEQLARALQGSGADAVYADVHYARSEALHQCVRYYSSAVFRRGLMRLGFMPAHPTFYCRRACYEQYGYFHTDYKIAADFELLLRLIYVHRISTCYLPADLVTMRTGGASNESWQSRVAIMRDHNRALHSYGYFSCYPLLALRYLYKFWEIVSTRFKHPTPLPAYVRGSLP